MKHYTLVLFIFIASILHSQTGTSFPEFNGIDTLIKKFMNDWNIPGGSVSFAKDGKPVYNKAFGFSDLAKTQAASPNNLYRIASVSKPITAIAIMKLIEQNRLSLSDTVFGKNKILTTGYFLNVISDSRIYAITVQNLLEHTAGWNRDSPYDIYEHSDAPFFPLQVTKVEKENNPVGDSTLIKFLLRKGLDFSPGTKFAYSNVGYLILGKIIEKISGLSYETFVRKNIFEPLDLHDIHLGKNLQSEKQEHEVEYFDSYKNFSAYGTTQLVPEQYGGFNLEAMNAHGGWIASSQDLTKLLLAVDGSITFPDILSKEISTLMKTPSTVNTHYAKGWSVNAEGNFWHTGSLNGTASFVCRTKNGYCWTFLFNSRADNSKEFWEAFDRLPWEALKSIRESSVSLAN